MIPIIKQNEVKTYYFRWLKEVGKPHKVLTIRFIQFCYNQGRHYENLPKPFYYEEDAYVAELWECLDLSTGKIIQCRFRHPVNGGKTKNHSITENKNPINNINEANLLTDSLSEYLRGGVNKRLFPNKLLKNENIKFENRKKIIQELLKSADNKTAKTGLFLILRHKQSPTLKTLTSVKTFKQENPEVYDQLIHQINNYEKTNHLNIVDTSSTNNVSIQN